jgi:hypothetical protein
VKPTIQALLLADCVYQDVSGKKIVAGIFHRLLFSKTLHQPKVIEDGGSKRVLIPGGVNAGSPYAYFCLTDVRGTIPCTIRYVDLKDERVLLHTNFTVKSDDPLAAVEGILPMPPLPTPHTGVYALELLCEDEPVGSLRIVVDEINEKQESADEPS